MSTVKSTSIIRELSRLSPVILDRPFTREEFVALADQYPDLQLEREKNGKVIILTAARSCRWTS